MDDIIELSRNISLRDPISLKRISIPARGIICRHVQPFDLETYLELNMRNPTWKCILCNELVPPEGIIIDSYLHSILLHTAHERSDEVSINDLGEWEIVPPSVDDDCSSDGDRCTIEREKRKAPSTDSLCLEPPPAKRIDFKLFDG
jgi:zinc finger MIZ domain-containing protein